ncbi:MAG: RHS repeat-associated core domain-containing protein [Phycisphaeraceae bacterium]|nr:RHS repeat-associated core domain-containing protein [Phycisphaeraceae bacterium]
MIDAADAAAASGATMGGGVLSHVSSKIGYAGYTRDAYVPTVSHVRHRVYKSDLGRWIQRDPAGYVDGPSLYEYAMSAPQSHTDPSGLLTSIDAAFRACFKQPTIALRIECLEGLLGILPGTKWDHVVKRMIDQLRKELRRKKPPSRITRGLTQECLRLYGIYKSAEAACRHCNTHSDCAQACIDAACWSTALAFRKKYDKKCPSPYADHKQARKQAQNAKAKCASRCASAGCREIINPDLLISGQASGAEGALFAGMLGQAVSTCEL